MKRKTRKQGKITISLAISLFFCLINGVLASEKTETLRKEIILLVNQERSKQGLNELVESSLLDQAAELKATDMLKENYFAHTSPSGIDPWFWFDKVDYSYKYAGENLGMDFSSAISVHRAWMKSPTHRENILSDKFSEIGVAVVEGEIDGRQTILAVQLFGSANSQEIATIQKFLRKENLAISIKESSVFPWKNSDGKSEALIFAEVTGLADKVEVVINEKHYPLERIRENNYLSLISLENWNPEKEQAVVVAKSPWGGEISELILPSQYFGYFTQKKQEKAEFLIPKEEVVAAGMADKINSDDFFSWKKLQDGVLVFGGLVFLLTIMNIWVLEREEARLLLLKCQN